MNLDFIVSHPNIVLLNDVKTAKERDLPLQYNAVDRAVSENGPSCPETGGERS